MSESPDKKPSGSSSSSNLEETKHRRDLKYAMQPPSSPPQDGKLSKRLEPHPPPMLSSSTGLGFPKELKYELPLEINTNYFPSASSAQISPYPGLQTRGSTPIGTTADAKKTQIKLAQHLTEHLKGLLDVDFGSVVQQLTTEQISYLQESSKINTNIRGFNKRVILMGLYLAYPKRISSYLNHLAKRGKPSLMELFSDFREHEAFLKKIFNSKYYDLLHCKLDPLCQKDFSDHIKKLSTAPLPILFVREMNAQIVRIPNLYPLKNEKEQPFNYYIIRLDNLLGFGAFGQVFAALKLDINSGRVKRLLNRSGDLQPEKWVAKLQETDDVNRPDVLGALSHERYIQTRTESPVAYRTAQPKTLSGKFIQKRGGTVNVICTVRPDIAGAGAGADGGADYVWATTLQDTSIRLSERLYILLMVANDLQKAHYYGIIHTDVKPSNIGILFSNDPLNDTGKPQAQLYDWGYSLNLNKLKLVEVIPGTFLRQSDRINGTVWYASPEAFRGQYSTQSDIFSFAYIWILLLSVGFNVTRFLSERSFSSSFNVSEDQPEVLPHRLFPNQENLICPINFLRNQMIYIINSMGAKEVHRRYSSVSVVQILSSLHIIISSATVELTNPEDKNTRRLIQFRELAKVLLLSSHIWDKDRSYLDYDAWDFENFPETCEAICRLAINEHLSESNLRQLFSNDGRVVPDESRALATNFKLSPDDEEDIQEPIKAIQIPSHWMILDDSQLNITVFKYVNHDPKWSPQKQAQYIKRVARFNPLLLFDIYIDTLPEPLTNLTKLLSDLKDDYLKSLALSLHPESNKLTSDDPGLLSLIKGLNILTEDSIKYVSKLQNPTAVYLLLEPEQTARLWAEDNKSDKAVLDKRVRWFDILNYLITERDNLCLYFTKKKYIRLLKEVSDYQAIFLKEVAAHLSKKTALFIPAEEHENLCPLLTERTGQQINYLLSATGTALQAAFLFLLPLDQQAIYLSLPQQKANRRAIFDYLTSNQEFLQKVFSISTETYDSILEMERSSGPEVSKSKTSEPIRMKTALQYAHEDLLRKLYKDKDDSKNIITGRPGVLQSVILASCPKNLGDLYVHEKATPEDKDIFTLLLVNISDIPLAIQELPQPELRKLPIRNLLLLERLIYRRDMLVTCFGRKKYEAVHKEISQAALPGKYIFAEKMCHIFVELIPRGISSLVEQLTPGQIVFCAADEEARSLVVMVLLNPKPIESYLEKLQEHYPTKFQTMCTVLKKESKILQELFKETYADVNRQVTDFMRKVEHAGEPSRQAEPPLDSKLIPVTPTTETDVAGPQAKQSGGPPLGSNPSSAPGTPAQLLSLSFDKGILSKETQQNTSGLGKLADPQSKKQSAP